MKNHEKRSDSMGVFCVCGRCVALTQVVAEYVANGELTVRHSSDCDAAKHAKRAIGGLVLEALFEMVGLGAA